MPSSPKKVVASTRLESDDSVGGSSSDDDDNGISKSTKPEEGATTKKRRLNEKEGEEAREPPLNKVAEEPDESTTAEQEEEEEEEAEELNTWKSRWQNQDRNSMLRLLRHRSGPVGMYQWNQHDMKLGVPTSATHLLGCDYDILFVRGVPHRTDQGYTDEEPIARTVPNCGMLKFVHTSITKGDFRTPDGTQVVEGFITNIPNTEITHGNNDFWQYTMQMNNITLREYKFAHANYSEGIPFSVIKVDRDDRIDDEDNVTIHVLANSGKFNWTATEAVDETGEEDVEGYSNFARKEIEQEYDPLRNVQSSWMCRHGIYLPIPVVCHIQSFCRRPLPPPHWCWQEGDLLITVKRCEYATEWTTLYLARPKSDTVRQNLLSNLEFFASSTTSDEEDEVLSDDDDDSDVGLQHLF